MIVGDYKGLWILASLCCGVVILVFFLDQYLLKCLCGHLNTC